MSNLPLGAEYDSNAPWNEKEPKFLEFDVEFIIIRTEKMALKVDEHGDILDSEISEIESWGKSVAKSLSCEFIDYEIL